MTRLVFFLPEKADGNLYSQPWNLCFYPSEKRVENVAQDSCLIMVKPRQSPQNKSEHYSEIAGEREFSAD